MGNHKLSIDTTQDVFKFSRRKKTETFYLITWNYQLIHKIVSVDTQKSIS
jgi:hypothetical protein